MEIVSATEADWSREKPRGLWDPSRQLLNTIRLYQRAQNKGGLLALFTQKRAVLFHRFWSVVTGADIPINSDLGGGLLLPHPNGIVIHPGASVGVNCLLFQQVTLAGPVVLGGHVDVGAGAKIPAPATIGDHAKIGANAVVTGDVPAHATAVGVPAKKFC